MVDEPDVQTRLDALEQDNRRLRRLSMYLVVGTGVLLGLAAALVVVASRHGLPGMTAALVEARRFTLRDAAGQTRGVWGTTEDGGVRLMLQDSAGRPRLRLTVLADGASGVAAVDEQGRTRIALGVEEAATLVLADAAGRPRTVLGLAADNSSTLLFTDGAGRTRAGLGVNPRGAASLTVVEGSAPATESDSRSPAANEADTTASDPQ